jgi:hypothetical protein
MKFLLALALLFADVSCVKPPAPVPGDRPEDRVPPPPSPRGDAKLNTVYVK